MCDPLLCTGIDAPVGAIEATPDFRWCFAGDVTGHIYYYDFFESISKDRRSLKAPKARDIREFSECGEKIASFATTVERPSSVTCMAVEDQASWMLSGHENGVIELTGLRIQSHEKVYQWSGQKQRISAIKVLPHSRHAFVSASWDKSLAVYDLDTGVSLGRHDQTHQCQISSVSFEAQGMSETSRMISAGVDGSLALWECRAKSLYHIGTTNSARKTWLTDVVWRPSSCLLYTAERSGRITEYDVRQMGAPVRQLKLPLACGAVLKLACASDYLMIGTAGDGCRMLSLNHPGDWDKGQARYHVLMTEPGPIGCLKLRSDCCFGISAISDRGFGAAAAAPTPIINILHGYDLTDTLGLPKPANWAGWKSDSPSADSAQSKTATTKRQLLASGSSQQDVPAPTSVGQAEASSSASAPDTQPIIIE